MDAPTPEGDSDAHTGPLAGHEDTCRVLIVDDEPDLRRLLGEVLADQGWSVAEAHHGEHALDRLQAERFAVVLLDHRMPGLIGR
jgi:CheY-like chemotaxis protein